MDELEIDNIYNNPKQQQYADARKRILPPLPRRQKFLFRGDRALWVVIAILSVISLLVVYSSTASMAYKNAGGNTSYYLTRQAIFILVGFFTIVVVHWIDLKSYIRVVPLLFKLALVAMCCVYILGETRNDASRWYLVPGLNVTFQPADFLKIMLMMYLAKILGARQRFISNVEIIPRLTKWNSRRESNNEIWNNYTKKIVMPIVLASLAIFFSNLSTTIIIFSCSMIVLWVGRVKISQICKIVGIAFAAMILMISVMAVAQVGRANTWINRIERFVFTTHNMGKEQLEVKGADYQELQAQIAIASGGVFGKGPGGSTQRSQLPHPYSDFAYAFIVEEYGLPGAIIVILLYLWVFFRARIIVYKTQKPTEGLIVLGLALISVFSAMIHIFVSVGIVPVTGQTLPLISLGGSSIIFTSISFGIILSISRSSYEREYRQKRAVVVALRRELLAQSPSLRNEEALADYPDYEEYNDDYEQEIVEPPFENEQYYIKGKNDPKMQTHLPYGYYNSRDAVTEDEDDIDEDDIDEDTDEDMDEIVVRTGENERADDEGNNEKIIIE